MLATQSPYKKALFSRLNIAFVDVAAHIDESPKPNEAAPALARRLAEEKAQKVYSLHTSTSTESPLIVIGADQVAACNDRLISKPNTHERALTDLLAASGKTMTFYTAASVLSPDKPTQHILDETKVHFRDLTTEEIDQYLAKETPYDCAGAFKAEGLGISLFKSIESQDPTALVGLPLIQLSHCLRGLGLDLYAET